MAPYTVPGPTFWEDLLNPMDLWNNFTSAKLYYPFSDTYWGLVVAVTCTVAHLVLDKVFQFGPKAEYYANQQAPLQSAPQWIPSNDKSLTYDKLKWTDPKQFSKTVSKTYSQFSDDQQRELISYQKSCNKHSKHISKYMEALFKVTVFGAIYLYGLCLIYVDGQWFWDQKYLWSEARKELPMKMGDDPIFNLKIYYYLQIGYALHRAYYQCFEHIRRDFWAMMIHHWVTAALLVGSYMIGYTQIGATVLLCNDNCDLLLPLAKLSEYAGYPKLQTLFTAGFIGLWFPMRIGVYGYKVMYSTMVDGYDLVRPYPATLLAVLGLLIIYVLQFFWSKLILDMIFQKLLKGKGVVDTRSDDEGNVIGKFDQKNKKEQ